MYLLMAAGIVGAIIGFAVLGLLYVPQLATISATFPAMFPAHVRYCGMAIAYNVSTSLFGGTAPAANDWLIDRTGSNLVPAYYMIAACLVGPWRCTSSWRPRAARCAAASSPAWPRRSPPRASASWRRWPPPLHDREPVGAGSERDRT